MNLIFRKFQPRKARCASCNTPMMQNSGSHKFCRDCAWKRHLKNQATWRASVGEIKNPGSGRGGPSGPRSHAWKYGCTIWQKKRFKGSKCERCSSRLKLELHHRDRDPTNWKKSNLETLCFVCHRKEHRGRRRA